MRRRRKGYLYALIAVSTIIIGWNALGLFRDEYKPGRNMGLHNLGLTAMVVLTFLYRDQRQEDITTILKGALKLGKNIGAEEERQRLPQAREALEVVARVPFQKSK